MDQAEQDTVLRDRKHSDDPLSWDELRKMSFTWRVLQETLRIANPAGFVFREATEDVILDGVLIPKGWKVMPWIRFYHFDPQLYKDPTTFDPSRFESPPKPNTYTPFGNGLRICPGSEVAKTEMLVFMHRFITTFDYEFADNRSTDMVNYPMPHFKDGTPIKVKRRHTSTTN